MTAITEQITNQSVIDAVSAQFIQGRAYVDHWLSYMNSEQKQSFSNSVAAFIRACEIRKRWLVQ